MKRIIAWIGFLVLVGLVIWGLIVANNRAPRVAEPVILPDPVSASDWSTGSTTAETVVIEYSDFQCPSCALYYPVVEKLVKEHGSQFRFIYRHFPLPQHKNAIPAAIAAEAAGKQGKFWEMASMILENQREWENLADATTVFGSYAEKIGLSVTQFKTDLSDKVIAKKLEDSVVSARRGRLQGTPTFFVNGNVIKTPQSYEEFAKIIQDTVR